MIQNNVILFFEIRKPIIVAVAYDRSFSRKGGKVMAKLPFGRHIIAVTRVVFP
jgi:hypothetical protein